MKGISAVLTVAVVFVLTTGTVFGSDYEKREGSRNERSEAYESKIYGTVEKLPAGLLGTWVVKGREVLVTKETVIKEKYGKIDVGSYVEVEGKVSGKTFTAREIEIKRDRK